MQKFIQMFRRSEDGAVTVDWVVLTAAIAGLGVSVIVLVSTAANDKSKGLGAHVESRAIVSFN